MKGGRDNEKVGRRWWKDRREAGKQGDIATLLRVLYGAMNDELITPKTAILVCTLARPACKLMAG